MAWKSKTKTIAALTVAASVALLPLAQPILAAAPTAKEYGTFLSAKYDITVNEHATKGQFIQYVADLLPGEATKTDYRFNDVESSNEHYAAVAELYEKGHLTGTTIQADQQLQPWIAAIIAVRAAGLKELAATYTTEKIDAALANINSTSSDWYKHVAQELAVAIDNGIIPEQYYDEFDSNKPASAEFVQYILGEITSYNGNYKNYIANSTDANLISELIAAYNTADIIQVSELQEIVDAALEQNIITGYNFKDARFEANFVDEYTLTYGHSDLTHAIQLIGLLRSEGLEAKVQLEPKTSAFLYLKEWGEPEQSESFQVKQIANGNYVAYSKEYDLSFEFNSIEDKEKFQKIIIDYAKKDADDEPGLIINSWWQPLYYSNTELDEYVTISNNKVTLGNYYAQTFSLNEQVESIAAGFKEVNPEVEVESYEFWANIAFYNYLGGTDYK
ncbi:hypothetical protein [Paenibacillus camelliae]|uniref:hypothetical protein n=1 Tax=Paenibacillus camelliae TaxID=512410 RepID=UPI0020414152|nr:hypothetical protein [Paenibacillus camelliae]MCM3633146.1 hypothetical protein [Paenibacillus camelliae]